jgi:hypothetical protein
LKIIKQSSILLGVLGPVYAGLSAYFLYVPKEKYWESLSLKKKNLLTKQIFQEDTDVDLMKPKKPIKRISLEVPKEQRK